MADSCSERGHSEGRVGGHHSALTDRAGERADLAHLGKKLPLQSVSLYIPLQGLKSGCSRREEGSLTSDAQCFWDFSGEGEGKPLHYQRFCTGHWSLFTFVL